MKNPFENDMRPSGGGQQDWFSSPAQPGLSSGVPSSSPFPGHPMAEMVGERESEVDLDNEPPILEELGINIEDVISRTKAVILLRSLPQHIVVEGDLTGPMLIIVSLMGALLLQGKMHLEQIFSLSVFFTLFMCALINLMSQKGGIDLYTTASLFGYGLLPVVLLALLSIVFSLSSGIIGPILCILTVMWCTLTSSKFVACAIDTQDQQYLFAYPLMLIYTAFIFVAVF